MNSEYSPLSAQHENWSADISRQIELTATVMPVCYSNFHDIYCNLHLKPLHELFQTLVHFLPITV